MPLFLFLSLLSLTMLSAVTVAAVLVLRACALDIGFLDRYSDCRPSSEIAAENRLASLYASRTDLIRAVYKLERDLGAIQCEAQFYSFSFVDRG